MRPPCWSAPGAPGRGIGAFEFGYDDGLADTLYAERDAPKLRMAGQQVYRHAVARMTEAAQVVLARNGVSVEDVDYFVAHQANARIVTAVADALGVPREKVSFNVEWTANTSAASIPLALAAAERDGHLATRIARRHGRVRRRLRLGRRPCLLEGHRHPTDKEHLMAELTEATVLAGVREELEQLKVPGAAEATMETEWRDLDIDSLELVELVTALEDRFDVKIADGELKSIAGVGDAVRITLALANESASA